ncbi:adenylyl-sulfate kinase [Candidatus Pelagibacter sp.]|nr:adenylyl-sulfate kinase [Candidatus Pelagibacter sp.]
MVIWIIGLSGAGKTTLANILKKKLIKKKYKFIHIDGDAIRKIYDIKLGYSFKDRSINAKRISLLAKFLADQKINLIVSVLSNYPEWLKWNKKNLKNYLQIYLKTDLNILKKRKPKLYRSKKKNIVGLDIKFNEPKKNNYVIINSTSLKTLNRAAANFIKINRL